MNFFPRRWALTVLLALAVEWCLADAVPGSERWMLASVDHYETGYFVLLAEFPEQGLAIRRLDLMILGIAPPAHGHLRHATETYHPVSALEEYRLVEDKLSQRALLVRRSGPRVAMPPNGPLLLTARMNRQPLDRPLRLHFKGGQLYLTPASARALGIAPRILEAADESPGVALHDVAGEKFSIDLKKLELIMTVPPENLGTTQIGIQDSVGGRHPQSSFSSILDYSLTSGYQENGDNWSTARADLSVGSGTTLCRSAHLYRSRQERTDRLQSRCLFDFPERMLSLGVGDSISAAGPLGQPVRYGGLHIGTDFSLAPEFITQPDLSLAGTARVPSVLEVWTNQLLALRRDIPPGPFEVNGIPVQTGAGEIRAVVDDGTGAPSVITRPFYSDPSLLQRGLLDWSIDAGRKREGLLTAHDGYGEAFGVLRGRYGVRDWLTLGWRGEIQDAVDMTAMSGNVRLGRLGVVQLGGAFSHSSGGVDGRAGLIGFSHRNDRFSLGYEETVTDADFAQLGYEQPGSAPSRSRRVSLGLSTGYRTSLTLTRVQREHRDRADQIFNSAAFSLPLPGRGSLQLSMLDPVAPERSPIYAAHFTLPLGAGHNLSASAAGPEADSHQLQLQRNLPAGPGLGYRVGTGEQDDRRFDHGDVQWRTRNALWQLHGRRTEESSRGYAQVSGSVVGADGLHLAPKSPASYGLVVVNEPGVRVFRENRLVGRTDRDGRLLVPGLRAYEDNRLSLAPEDLPLNATIRHTEVNVVPGRRQALIADFETSRQRYLLTHLRREDGEPVPAGARLRIAGHEREFMVGRGGLIYVPAPASGELTMDVGWQQGSCRARIHLSDDVTGRLEQETLLCR